MREGKVRRLHDWLADRGAEISSLADAFFYSDSINDAALLRAVGRPVAVDPDERLAALAVQSGWSVVRMARFDAPLNGRR
jgi:phosphoserine phosphatase